jgi:hypothetical protein
MSVGVDVQPRILTFETIYEPDAIHLRAAKGGPPQCHHRQERPIYDCIIAKSGSSCPSLP